MVVVKRRLVRGLRRIGREAIGKARVVGFLLHRMGNGKRVRVRMRMRLGMSLGLGTLLVLMQVDQRRAAIVVVDVVIGTVAVATAAVSASFANNLEKRHRHQPPGTRDERVAGFVPIRIVLPADDVKEVPLAERQFLGVMRIVMMIVKGFNDLVGEKRFFLIKALNERMNETIKEGNEESVQE